MPGQLLGFGGGRGSQISGLSARDVVKVFTRIHVRRPHLAAIKYSWYSFLSEPGIIPSTHFYQSLSRLQRRSATGRIVSVKNSNTPSGIEFVDFSKSLLYWRLKFTQVQRFLKISQQFRTFLSVVIFNASAFKLSVFNYFVNLEHFFLNFWR